MTYKLALQLKNAGFPQKDRPFCVSTKMELDEKGEQVRCYIPTLSELIDFVDGSDILNSIEKDYVGKTLFKLQKDKEK